MILFNENVYGTFMFEVLAMGKLSKLLLSLMKDVSLNVVNQCM